MAAYVVVHATKLNDEKFEEYASVAGPSIVACGGEVLTRGLSETLAGESTHKMMVIAKFPTKEEAKKWYNSPEYQAIIPTRNEAMDAIFVLGGE